MSPLILSLYYPNAVLLPCLYKRPQRGVVEMIVGSIVCVSILLFWVCHKQIKKKGVVFADGAKDNLFIILK